MRMRLRRAPLWGLVGLAAVLGAGPAAPAAPDDPASRPEREVVVAFEFPKLEVESSGSLSLSLIAKNNGRKDETLILELAESPPDLRSKLEEYGKVVGGVFVPSGERKTLTVSAKPKPVTSKNPDEAKPLSVLPGIYKFAVKSSTEDGKLSSRAEVQVTVKAAAGEGEGPKDPIAITCAYPNLRGANDSDFKFSVNLHNNTDLEDMASLRAEAPRGWEVSFKPSYENKYIGSLKVEANQQKSVDVEVKPPPGAETGKYPFTIYSKLSKKDLEAKKELVVELTGTFRVQCRTLNDLLSLTAKGGSESNVSMYVMNRGTAPLTNVGFDSFKPENWKVTFKPERFDSIAPGKMEQVFAHRTYRASSAIRLFYLLFGAASFQGPALRWASDHRLHHARTDLEEDPHNIRKGFWWAHIGWLFYRTQPNLDLAPDLLEDPLVRFQERFYLPLGMLFGFALPALIAAAWGDPLGGLLLGGFLRLLIQYHATFAINSVAHMVGRRPYSTQTSARDSVITAILTLGEGYHNYHHRFPGDYRNGILARHFDPTKWWVWALSKMGLAWDLKRAPEEAIRQARERSEGPKSTEPFVRSRASRADPEH